jgi:hypothetical protein
VLGFEEVNTLTLKNFKVKDLEPDCLRHTALTILGEANCDVFIGTATNLMSGFGCGH